MVKKFTVDQVVLYINWDNATIFSDVILVSNYHGCKEGEAINFILHYILDIIYKTVKPSHSEKLKIIPRYK